MLRHFYRLTALLALIAGLLAIGGAPVSEAQVRISPTPLSAILPIATPLPTSAALPTATPTRTPTPLSAATLRLGTNIESANIRAQPDTSADILGQLERGVNYVVRGRYVRWLQFEYNRSPTGYGWVFDELVELDGDTSRIPNVENPFAPPGLLSSAADNTNAEASQSEDSRLIQIPAGGIASDTTAIPNTNGRLPTFTPPPDFASVLALRTPDVLIGSEEQIEFSVLVQNLASRGIPPILPIAALFVFGVLGLLVAQIRK